MTSLLAKLEAATAGSRELDAEIASALGWENIKNGRGSKPGSIYQEQSIPEWTHSLDAALTLVPEGWRVERVSTGDPHLTESNPERLPQCVLVPYLRNDEGWLKGRVMASAATAPLALCIAALRAREKGE